MKPRIRKIGHAWVFEFNNLITFMSTEWDDVVDYFVDYLIAKNYLFDRSWDY